MLKMIWKQIRLVGLICILVLGAVLIGGCTTETEEAEAISYTIADPTGDWGYPTPYSHYSRGPGYIRMSFVFDTLVWKDDSGSGFIPALAKEWDYIEDENAYIFKLRENVTWHDGKKFTAEDVAFTIGYVKEHPMPFVTLIGPSGVKEARIIDVYTIKFYLEQLYAPFLNDVAGTLAILPKHIWEQVDAPEKFTDAKGIVGTGPYKLADYSKEHGTYLYEAYENYYLGKPAVDKLKFVKVIEQMVPAALKDGSIDAGSIPPELAQEIEAKGFTVIQAPCGWNAKLTMNHTKEPLSIKEFRQALAYAIDRKALVEITQRGHATPGSPGMIPIDSEWYNPNIEQYNYNPEKAKELLEGLGYRFEGGRFIKDSEVLELELFTSSRHGFVEVGEFIKQQLESTGIKVNLRSLEGKSLDAKVQAWQFDLSVYGHGGLYEPSILKKVVLGKGFNSARYEKSETLNELLEDQFREMDPVKRKELVNQIQEVYAGELPALTLYYPNWYWAHNGKVDIFYTQGGVGSGIPIPLNKMAFMKYKGISK